MEGETGQLKIRDIICEVIGNAGNPVSFFVPTGALCTKNQDVFIIHFLCQLVPHAPSVRCLHYALTPASNHLCLAKQQDLRPVQIDKHLQTT